MKREWKDITSYSQNSKNRLPRCFETKIGKFRLVVVWNHIDTPNTWSFSLYGILEHVDLDINDYSKKEEVFEKALQKVKEYLSDLIKEI